MYTISPSFNEEQFKHLGSWVSWRWLVIRALIVVVHHPFFVACQNAVQDWTTPVSNQQQRVHVHSLTSFGGRQLLGPYFPLFHDIPCRCKCAPTVTARTPSRWASSEHVWHESSSFSPFKWSKCRDFGLSGRVLYSMISSSFEKVLRPLFGLWFTNCALTIAAYIFLADSVPLCRIWTLAGKNLLWLRSWVKKTYFTSNFQTSTVKYGLVSTLTDGLINKLSKYVQCIL